MKDPQSSRPYHHFIDNKEFQESVHVDWCERKRENESSKLGGKFRKGLMSNWTTNFTFYDKRIYPKTNKLQALPTVLCRL